MTARLCDELMTAAVERRAPKSLAEIMVANPAVVLADNGPANPDTAYDALYEVHRHLSAAMKALEAARRKHSWGQRQRDYFEDTAGMLDNCRDTIDGMMSDIEEYGE
jgi:hypothetical protein